MRKAKKLLSLLLMLCMVMTLLPTTALAAPDDTDDLSAVGESNGTENTAEELSPDELGRLHRDGYEPVSGPVTSVTLNMTESDGSDDGIAPLALTQTGTPVTDRYTVLVLDCSGSMYGQPVEKMKDAAQSFCRQMVGASSSNRVALVPFDDSVWPVTSFTNDLSVLTSAISSLSDRGGTNINLALKKADDMLRSIPSSPGTVKNIILLSDGLPEYGESKTTGRYNANDDSLAYSYANVCYETARDQLWASYNVYTLGFLHSMSGNRKDFCARFLRDLQNRLYYEVQDGDELIFVFEDIVEDINAIDEDPIVIIPGTMQGTAAGITNGRDGVQGTYKALVDSLCANFPDREVYVFGYNPENSMADSAKELNSAIAAVLAGSECDKVDLVCHSTGGLVASSYYEQFEAVSYSTRKVDKIITCGTPYEGYPGIINTVSGQGSFLASSSGFAELTPTTQYVDKVHMWREANNRFHKITRISTSDYERAMRNIFPGYNEAAAVQNSIRDGGYNALLSYSKSYFVVGFEKDKNGDAKNGTIASVVFNKNNDSISDLNYHVGDGTTPLFSATMMYQANRVLYAGERWQHFAVDHNGTVTDSACIQWISEILNDGQSTTPGAKIKRGSYVVIRIACPVDVFVPGPDGAGRELSSDCPLTDFGRLDIIGSEDDPIKMLCLDADTYDKALIVGTGSGTMDISVRYFDNVGTLVSEKATDDITVSKDAVYSLYVPESKDGTVTVTDKATGNVTTVEQPEDFVPVPEDDEIRNIPDDETREAPVNESTADAFYISIPSSVGGQVIPNTRYAEAGERVTLTVHPSDSYETTGLSVTDIRGRALTLREVSRNQWSFVMPACDVKVTASFAKIDSTDAPAQEKIPGTSHTTANPNDEPFTGLGTPGISGIVLNPAAMPFSDVRANDWFYDNVEYMWKHYLMSGVSDTQFSPNTTTTRGMIWTIVARMNNVRTDINPGNTWYERGMLWCKEQGVTDGNDPMADITREQLATMLWRNAGSPGGTGDLSRFSDSAEVSGYAASAVRWAVGVGVLKGSNGKLNPQGTATRAEVAAMVARYGDKVA